MRAALAGMALGLFIVGSVFGVALHSLLPSSPAEPPLQSLFQPPAQAGPDTASGGDAQQPTVDRVTAGVVDISTTIAGGAAAGTGMVLTSGGEVLTNNHVIAGSRTIRVQVAGTGPHYEARVIGDDPIHDVALLQVQGAPRLATVALGDSSRVSVGDAVVAIGNALARAGPPTVSTGYVTGLDRTISAGDPMGSTETLSGLIQINAPIQAGDSGGPLVSSAGQVIGMNTAADGGSRRLSASRVAFAIPINSARGIAQQIESGRPSGSVQIGPGAFLGVAVTDPSVDAGAASAEGALIIRVEPDSPAHSAGLAPGDTILAVGGRQLDSAASLSPAIRAHHPGDHVQIAWVDPQGSRHSAAVRLAAGPPA